MLISASTEIVIDVSQKIANLFQLCDAIDGPVADADCIHSIDYRHGENEAGEKTHFVHFDGRITADSNPHLHSRHMRQLVLGRGPRLFVMQYQPFSGLAEIVRNDFELDYLAKLYIKVNRGLDAPANQHIFGKTRK
jgi:hypothetical protein